MLAHDELLDAIAGAQTVHRKRAFFAVDFELEQVRPLSEARVDARDDAALGLQESEAVVFERRDRPLGVARKARDAAEFAEEPGKMSTRWMPCSMS